MKSLPRSLEDPPSLAGAGTMGPDGGDQGFLSLNTTSSICFTFAWAESWIRRCSARMALSICIGDDGEGEERGEARGVWMGSSGGSPLRSGSNGDAMMPDKRDVAALAGAAVLRDDDDDDAGNDSAHLFATFTANPGLAASRSRAASIRALCASRRPFGADSRLIFPLDEGFDKVWRTDAVVLAVEALG